MISMKKYVLELVNKYMSYCFLFIMFNIIIVCVFFNNKCMLNLYLWLFEEFVYSCEWVFWLRLGMFICMVGYIVYVCEMI